MLIEDASSYHVDVFVRNTSPCVRVNMNYVPCEMVAILNVDQAQMLEEA